MEKKLNKNSKDPKCSKDLKQTDETKSSKTYKSSQELGKKYKKFGKDKEQSNGIHYNDMSWWDKYPALMDTAVALPFNHLPGTDLFPGIHMSDAGKRVVGAIRHTYTNAYGNSYDATDACNMSFRDLWLKMHRQYRGIGAYQAADLGIVQIATIEVLACAAEIERIYGVINKYAIYNRNFPYTLTRALGLSDALTDNIRLNLANFRYGVNVLLEKAQSLCVFKDMSIISDKLSLASNVFLDRNSDDAQAIVYVNNFHGIYEAEEVPSGSAVLFFDKTSRADVHVDSTWLDYAEGVDGPTYECILNYLNARIEALVSDDDVQRIYSDMLAAFGPESLLKVLTLHEDYEVTPVYTNEILHKEVNMYMEGSGVNLEEGALSPLSYDFIHLGSALPQALLNALNWGSNFPDSFSRVSDRMITQYNNIINTVVTITESYTGGDVIKQITRGRNAGLYADSTAIMPISIGYTNSFNNKHGILNIFESNPTRELVCEGCLWKYSLLFDYDPSSETALNVFESTGPEIMLPAKYFARGHDRNTGTTNIIESDPFTNFIDDNPTTIGNLLSEHILQDWTKYDWQFIFYMNTIEDAGTINEVDYFGEIDRVRLVGDAEIYPIQRAALMSAMKL